ncbi:hypothetical protein [Rhizobium sp. LC145]|uniref:hypothetical protein n=1 Tax=Rhizobium sp. LC145 TaxID=1120688 RepID=UPI00062A038E|nr:hypothetical protein [Rhizobium sp. LC145]KKX29452.1 hypothetical protein YH62_16955 [Rhizobium sp. LC145]MDX3927995.1 hypothetical protein [Shinella sp.]TKT66169.1 hypothetical protein FDR95_06730 [Rhizobiaceae bacterium LC148]
MRKSLQILISASAIAGVLGFTVPLFAQENSSSSNQPKGNEMMGSGDMMGMMNMMTQMSQMMENCNKMMQTSMDKDHGTGAPKDGSTTPEKKG